jgi:hypothetical protein
MAKWRRYVLVGKLHWTPLGYVLQADDGRMWYLDISDMDAGGLIGEQIIVDGVRLGYNLFEVSRIAELWPKVREADEEAE